MIAWFKQFLNKPIPDRAGWAHIFGSMLLALLVLQTLSGILLGFIYSPSPDNAWRSIQFVSDVMPGGSWIRGIHYWGASLLIILLGLHLIRTFLYAAYKKPRALIWIAGVLLLMIMLAFAQTGYLLPWDQKAYWGTNVTIEIMGTVPYVGPLLEDLARGGSAINALTLSRFYLIHVAILPLLGLVLVALHLLLIQRYGITAPWTNMGELPQNTQSFYPYQAARDSTGMLIIVAFTLLLAWLVPAPLGLPADPNDNTFAPRPDWYFLFLFQLLTYFEGKWEIIGTVILPGVATTLLFLLPFIDRNPSRRLKHRPLAVIVLMGSIGMWAYLTYAAVEGTPRKPSWHRPQGILIPRAERVKRPAEVGGMTVLKSHCFSCHSLTVLGPKTSLQSLARKFFPTGEIWLEQHLIEKGRNTDLTSNEVEQLMATLRVASNDRPELLYSIPQKARLGANLFYSTSCVYCHKIDGQGGDQSEVPAPDLTYRMLRPKQWHIKHIKDPRTLVPNSQMPPFLHSEPWEYEALAEYIIYLHTP